MDSEPPADDPPPSSRLLRHTTAHASMEGYPAPVATAPPTRAPNVHPRCLNVPGTSGDGFEELCHLVTEQDPDTALCGQDVSGYPWNPPWPRCEACLAVARGEMN
jgi:hypothetical protein